MGCCNMKLPLCFTCKHFKECSGESIDDYVGFRFVCNGQPQTELRTKCNKFDERNINNGFVLAIKFFEVYSEEYREYHKMFAEFLHCPEEVGVMLNGDKSFCNAVNCINCKTAWLTSSSVGTTLGIPFLEAVDRIDGNGEIMHVPSLTKYTVKNGKVADLNIDYISPNNDKWMIL